MYRNVKLFGSRAKISILKNNSFSFVNGVGLKNFRLFFLSSKNLRSREPQYSSTKGLALPTNTELIASKKCKFLTERNVVLNELFIGCDSFNGCSNPYSTIDSQIVNNCSARAFTQSPNNQVNVPGSSSGDRAFLTMIDDFAYVDKKPLSKELNKYHGCNTDNTTVSSLLGSKKDFKHKPYSLYTGNPVSYLYVSTRPNHVLNYSTGKFTKSEKLHETNELKSAGSTTTVSYKDKFKAAIKDYGIVIVVFHITISIISLGACYLLIASGAAQSDLFKSWGIDEGATTAGVAAAFIIAYAIHKTMAPWRIGITLTVVPFLVRRLRMLGYLKTPKPKQE